MNTVLVNKIFEAVNTDKHKVLISKEVINSIKQNKI